MDWLFLLGRILFGGFFLLAGWNHFSQLKNMAGYAQAKGVPMPQAAVAGTGALLILGGASILLGIFPMVGGILLIIFLVPTALMMHNFWALTDPQAKMMEMQNFLRNIALTGANLMLLSYSSPWPMAVMP
jgi:uncharacterized membrane protein YphA (DoxX/SURF4 family)